MTIRQDVEQVQELIEKILRDLPPEEQPPATNVIKVTHDDNLQAAIDQAAINDAPTTIRVVPATYDGIKMRANKQPIIIASDTSAIPEMGQRVTPDYSEALIKLRSNAGPLPTCIVTENGAHDYMFIGVQPLPGRPEVAMVELGKDTDLIPQVMRTVFDRCLFLADPEKGGKRGIATNCGTFQILNSHFDHFWFKEDSQCVGGWNGPGPFLVQNNYLSATGENLCWGGSDSTVAEMMPGVLVVRGNTLTKRLEWMGVRDHVVKNSFELKAIRQALVEQNIIEYSWYSGQPGFVAQITPRNQQGHAPWSGISDFTCQDNIFRHGAGGLALMGLDNLHPTTQTIRTKILRNLFYDIYPSVWGRLSDGTIQNGRMFQITNGPADTEIAYNILLGNRLNSMINMDKMSYGLNVHHNIADQGAYGIFGNGKFGADGWAASVDDTSKFENNIIKILADSRKVTYPGDTNIRVLESETNKVLDAMMRVLPAYKGYGCDVDKLLQLTGATL